MNTSTTALIEGGTSKKPRIFLSTMSATVFMLAYMTPLCAANVNGHQESGSSSISATRNRLLIADGPFCSKKEPYDPNNSKTASLVQKEDCKVFYIYEVRKSCNFDDVMKDLKEHVGYTKVEWTFHEHKNANGTINLKVQLKPLNIRLAQWPCRNLTQKNIDAFRKFTKDLQNHEFGHVDIARKLAAQFSRAGLTQEQSSNIQNRLENIMQQAHDSYDDVTKHGAEQSKGPTKGFRGGNDVKLDLEFQYEDTTQIDTEPQQPSGSKPRNIKKKKKP
jgi:predicted secreted Zn-dependent protease